MVEVSGKTSSNSLLSTTIRYLASYSPACFDMTTNDHVEEKTMGETQYIDEVVKSADGVGTVQYDAQEEKKAVRKLDLCLISM